ncbi:GMP synthase [Sansalvadorimonas sp. 2012CJ34-2]|uniref:GMP synthase n=1 Tax=Parendozoicomonas callyspongiae TaxID=2942213 RepID=A0ABT0PCX4_9GAMM|nr:GMP synthase [Sansalvadorimonas sp. 2012CJ34-2]MCL6269153.1 GMP synthase [Sansalvadorimonas sp. 2012CJ34-2]
MKIGILQCDDVQEQFLAEHKNYPEMFMNLFLKEDPTCTFSVYKVHEGELPASTKECPAWIITGSRYSVYENLPWLPPFFKFVRQLYKNNCKLVGICFGHQVIAQALGGSVSRSEKGWGVGMSFNQVTHCKPWMQPSSKSLNLIVSHQDQIMTLPDSARILASSDFCPYYMVSYDDHFLSIQGHPEFSHSYIKDLMLSRKGRIPEERIAEGLNSLHTESDAQLSIRWILKFLFYASSER